MLRIHFDNQCFWNWNNSWPAPYSPNFTCSTLQKQLVPYQKASSQSECIALHGYSVFFWLLSLEKRANIGDYIKYRGVVDGFQRQFSMESIRTTKKKSQFKYSNYLSIYFNLMGDFLWFLLSRFCTSPLISVKKGIFRLKLLSHRICWLLQSLA